MQRPHLLGAAGLAAVTGLAALIAGCPDGIPNFPPLGNELPACKPGGSGGSGGSGSVPGVTCCEPVGATCLMDEQCCGGSACMSGACAVCTPKSPPAVPGALGGCLRCGLGTPTPDACDATNTCVDFATDTSNCGSCGHACQTGQTCVAGKCTCPAPKSQCPDGCFDTSNDVDHCGGCGAPPCVNAPNGSLPAACCNGVCEPFGAGSDTQCGPSCDSCAGISCDIGSGVFCDGTCCRCGSSCVVR